MEKLCYATLEKLGYGGFLCKSAPEKVLQFGEGNFLRAFAEYFFDVANEKADWNGKCVLVKPTVGHKSRLVQAINDQEGLYTPSISGAVKTGKRWTESASFPLCPGAWT